MVPHPTRHATVPDESNDELCVTANDRLLALGRRGARVRPGGWPGRQRSLALPARDRDFARTDMCRPSHIAFADHRFSRVQRDGHGNQ
jgi:hypothetical protein